MGRWSRYRALTVEERRLLHRAAALLAAVAAGLSLMGMKRMQSLLAGSVQSLNAPEPVDRRTRARLCAEAVNRAAASLPLPPACLPRSLALWWMLRRRGIAGELQVGVRPGTGAAPLDAHAWVELDGEVLNDRPDVRRSYAAFHNPVEAAKD